MAGCLTAQQFEALAELLQMRANSKSREIARLVLVNGADIGEAARQCGASYNVGHQAVKRANDGLALARAAIG